MSNSNDHHKAGSGDTLGTIDLGPFGTIDVQDDGCNDADLHFRGDAERLRRIGGIGQRINEYRRENGDDALMDALADLNTGTDRKRSNDDDGPPDPPTASKCADCNKTFPGRRLEYVDGVWKCPECADDDESE